MNKDHFKERNCKEKAPAVLHLFLVVVLGSGAVVPVGERERGREGRERCMGVLVDGCVGVWVCGCVSTSTDAL